MKRLVILGATGSIGSQTLAVCAQLNEEKPQYQIVALTANSNWQKLAELARQLQPQVVAIADNAAFVQLQAALIDLPIRVLGGASGVAEAAAVEADLVVAAIAGMAGLQPLLAAMERGTPQIALANKEALVAAGDLVMPLAKAKGIEMLPLDSEHSALWQCLRGEENSQVAKLILTASGGAFRDTALAALKTVTPQMALRHPNWQMGAKVTIDSATMANKGLEIIEAHWLFAMPYDKIAVLVHRQSIVHSLVEYADGNIKALLSASDMRLPIHYALTEGRREATALAKIDLAELGRLDFAAPDEGRFPALAAFRAAGEQGGTAPAYLNGANEQLVQAFLNKKIPFIAIGAILQQLASGYNRVDVTNLAIVLAADKQGRQAADKLIASY